jgi:hypothetical protein
MLSDEQRNAIREQVRARHLSAMQRMVAALASRDRERIRREVVTGLASHDDLMWTIDTLHLRFTSLSEEGFSNSAIYRLATGEYSIEVPLSDGVTLSDTWAYFIFDPVSPYKPIFMHTMYEP